MSTLAQASCITFGTQDVSLESWQGDALDLSVIKERQPETSQDLQGLDPPSFFDESIIRLCHS